MWTHPASSSSCVFPRGWWVKWVGCRWASGCHPPSPPLTLPRHLGPLCGLQGWTALYRACYYDDGSRTEIVKVLVEANADVNIPSNVSLAVQLGGKGVVMGRGLQRPTDRTPSPSRMGTPPCTGQHSMEMRNKSECSSRLELTRKSKPRFVPAPHLSCVGAAAVVLADLTHHTLRHHRMAKPPEIGQRMERTPRLSK